MKDEPYNNKDKYWSPLPGDCSNQRMSKDDRLFKTNDE